MKTIYTTLSIGLAGAVQRDELEVPDEASEDEIQEIVKDWANNYIDFGWSEEKPRTRW